MEFSSVIYDLLNKANSAEQEGDLLQAETWYIQILGTDPNYIEAYQKLINLAYKTKRWQNTGNVFYTLLKTGKNLLASYFFLGLVCRNIGNLQETSTHYNALLKLSNYNSAAWLSLSKIAYDNSEFDLAAIMINKILSFDNNTEIKLASAMLLNNIACQFNEKDNFQRGITYFKQAIDLAPNNSQYYFNLGSVLSQHGEYTNAIPYFEKVLESEPNNPHALNNYGLCLVEKGKLSMALKCLQQAVGLLPEYIEARSNLGKLLLQLGNLEEGFKENEWRTKKAFYSQGPFNKERWRGEIFSGKRVLVHSEQGYGDIIQFARYLPLLKSRGGTVLFSTHKVLMDIFSTLPGVDYLIEQSDPVIADTNFDFIVPLMSLPAIFGTSLKTIPCPKSYITVDSDRANYWRHQLAGSNKLKVGLVWAAKLTDRHSQERSCGFNAFQPFFDVPGIEFFSLQKGEGAKQLPPYAPQLIDYTQALDSFADTAALISNLDLVISVDTSVTHLAGAMGKTVWTLLRFVPDWRWLMDRADTPWYPSMRLFRQKNPDNWAEVIQKAALELQKTQEQWARTNEI